MDACADEAGEEDTESALAAVVDAAELEEAREERLPLTGVERADGALEPEAAAGVEAAAAPL